MEKVFAALSGMAGTVPTTASSKPGSAGTVPPEVSAVSPALAEPVELPHVTVKFAPGPDILSEFWGQKVTVTVTGYACDGRNEGIRVTLHAKNKALQEKLAKVAAPHMTLSVAEGARARDTGKLAFQDIAPISFRTVFGVCLNDKKTVITDRRQNPAAAAAAGPLPDLGAAEVAFSRYIVPFYWDPQKDSYEDIVRRMPEAGKEAHPTWQWKECGARRGEQEVYDHILDSLKEDPEDASNIGSVWAPSEKTGGPRPPKMRFCSCTGNIYAVEVAHAGIYLFRSGIGLFWYEIRVKPERKPRLQQGAEPEQNGQSSQNGQTIDAREWMRLQNRIKELSSDMQKEPGKNREKSRMTWAENTHYICLGEWINDVLSEGIRGVSYFSTRRAGRRTRAGLVPDKTLIYQYVLWQPKDIRDVHKQNQMLKQMAYCLTEALEPDKMHAPADLGDSAFYSPFRDRQFFAAKSGCGMYALYDPRNDQFMKYTLKDRWVNNYFPLYMLLLHQSFSLLNFTQQMERSLPADAGRYQEGDQELVENLDSFRIQIQSFLMKDIYASVAHMGNIDQFYRYVKERLQIQEDFRELEEGLETLAAMQHLLREKKEEEERQKEQAARERREEQEKLQDQKIQNLLLIVSILAIFSAMQDFSTMWDRVMGYQGEPLSPVHIIVFVVLAFIGVVLLFRVLKSWFHKK